MPALSLGNVVRGVDVAMSSIPVLGTINNGLKLLYHSSYKVNTVAGRALYRPEDSFTTRLLRECKIHVLTQSAKWQLLLMIPIIGNILAPILLCVDYYKGSNPLVKAFQHYENEAVIKMCFEAGYAEQATRKDFTAIVKTWAVNDISPEVFSWILNDSGKNWSKEALCKFVTIFSGLEKTENRIAILGQVLNYWNQNYPEEVMVEGEISLPWGGVKALYEAQEKETAQHILQIFPITCSIESLTEHISDFLFNFSVDAQGTLNSSLDDADFKELQEAFFSRVPQKISPEEYLELSAIISKKREEIERHLGDISPRSQGSGEERRLSPRSLKQTLCLNVDALLFGEEEHSYQGELDVEEDTSLGRLHAAEWKIRSSLMEGMERPFTLEEFYREVICQKGCTEYLSDFLHSYFGNNGISLVNAFENTINVNAFQNVIDAPSLNDEQKCDVFKILYQDCADRHVLTLGMVESLGTCIEEIPSIALKKNLERLVSAKWSDSEEDSEESRNVEASSSEEEDETFYSCSLEEKVNVTTSSLREGASMTFWNTLSGVKNLESDEV